MRVLSIYSTAISAGETGMEQLLLFEHLKQRQQCAQILIVTFSFQHHNRGIVISIFSTAISALVDRRGTGVAVRALEAAAAV